MNNLTSALTDIQDWETLGLRLDVTWSTIKRIAKESNSSGGPHLCRASLLDHWLRNDAAPSWEKVASALEEMDRRDVARKVRAAYCS